MCVYTGDVSCPHLAGSITVQIPPRACRCSPRGDSVPDENGASVPLTWPLPSTPPLLPGLGFGCVCARTGRQQNRLLLIAQDSEPGEEGALVVVVGQEMVVVVLMSG